jgi:hypothetical protein
MGGEVKCKWIMDQVTASVCKVFTTKHTVQTLECQGILIQMVKGVWNSLPYSSSLRNLIQMQIIFNIYLSWLRQQALTDHSGVERPYTRRC